MDINEFSYENILGGYKILGYEGNARDIVIPEGVIEIAKDAFIETDIQTLVLPSTLVEIGNSAFYDCNFLKSVSFPHNGSLLHIGEYAFGFCWQLREISLPSGMNFIGMNAFYSCYKLERVEMYADCERVKSEIFLDCRELKVITIHGDSLPGHWHQLWNCTNIRVELKKLPKVTPKSCTPASSHAGGYQDEIILNSVDINKKSDKVKSPKKTEYKTNVGENLTPLDFPAGVTVIEEGMFASSSTLVEVMMPIAIEAVMDNAFSDCRKLSAVCFGQNLSVIGRYAFAGCSALKAISIPEKVKNISPGCFRNCTALQNADLSSTRVISEEAFFGCDSLVEITLPATVVRLADKCLGGKSLKRICVKGYSYDDFFEKFGMKWLGEYSNSGLEIVFDDGKIKSL